MSIGAELKHACKNGDVVQVGAWVDKHAKSYKRELHERKDYLFAALKAAIAGEHPEVIRILLDWDQVKLVDDKGSQYATRYYDYRDRYVADSEPALHKACKSGNTECVELLVRDKRMTSYMINMKDNNGKRALTYATKNHPEVVKILLASNDVDLGVDTDNMGNTILHEATSNGNAGCVELLIQDRRMTSELINKQNSDGQTALMIAAKEHPEALKMMLSRNDVDLVVTDGSNNTALHKACSGGNSHCVELLINDRRITMEIINQQNNCFETALMIAASNHPEALKSMLDCKDVDLAVTDNEGNTALHIASFEGFPGCVDVLVQDYRMNREIINKWNKEGKTTLIHAVNEKQPDVVRILIARDDLEVEATDDGGNTSLHLACNDGSADLVKLIGQDKKMTREIINKENYNGDTALMVAVSQANLGCVEEMSRLDGVDWDTRNKKGKSLEAVASNFNHSFILKYLDQRKLEKVSSTASPVKSMSEKLKDITKDIEILEARKNILILKQTKEKEDLEKKKEEDSAILHQKQAKEKEALTRNHHLKKNALDEKHEDAMSEHREKYCLKMAEIQTLLTPVVAPPPTPECPVCLEAMPPPTQIFTCPNGHLECGPCKETVTKCSICMQLVMGRATVMEQMLRTMYSKV